MSDKNDPTRGFLKMASGYGLDAEGMAKAAVDVDKVNNDITSELRSLRSGLEPLIGIWKGSAATSFGKLMEQWGAETEKLNQALGGIASTLKEQSGGYMLQEEEASSNISSIAAGLDG
ncbi:WXG100 family type VII secretion target [Crossiella cryophila]|uniref:WXG100 family type VII secretion target n=1 Tax=Crossiella cryophila TaxID=43355 RepID=A0A7W7C4B6_9PSEU|nr:WXG100 family type VII secretion target [Crossiella cryophila]MBB4674306.1 WXG100 family type VII secretion target [Crossiella cryophila]